MPLSTQVYKWLPANYGGGVEIFLVASRYKTRISSGLYLTLPYGSLP